jgi:hypothetical protein
VSAQNGHIDVDQHFEEPRPKGPTFTPPKPKAKKTPLPDKLVGQGSGTDQALLSRANVELVPGEVGECYSVTQFEEPRAPDATVTAIRVKVRVMGELERMMRVRKDASILEILGGALAGEDFLESDKLKLPTKPFKMQEDAEFRFETVRSIVRMSLNYTTSDGRLLRFGVEVSTNASLPEIIAEAQKRAEEGLEDPKFYSIFHIGNPVTPPWNQATYEIRQNCMLTTSVVAKFRNNEITVTVPINHPETWQRIVYSTIPDTPLTVVQTRPTEFTATYEDEIRPWKVRYILGDEGEEREVKLLPFWENQGIRIRDAFGRDMKSPSST